jgi:outer membrane protein TolC
MNNRLINRAPARFKISRALLPALALSAAVILHSLPVTAQTSSGNNTRAFDEETITLTLDDAIRIAQRQSPAAQIAMNRYQQRSWDFRAFRAQLYPRLVLQGNVPGINRTINPITQGDGTVEFRSQNQLRSSVNLAVNQGIPLTGGNLFVQSGINRVDLILDNASNTIFYQSSPLVVGLNQPLFQFNNQRWNIRTESIREEITDKQFHESMEEVAIENARRFFEVYIAKMNVENARLNVAINDTIYTISGGRFEVGRIAENELLQSELALLNAETSLANAQLEYDRAVRNLKLHLNLPQDVPLEVIPPTGVAQLAIDVDFAVAEALKNRSDRFTFDLQEMEADREISRARHASRLSANMSATFGLNQRADNIPDVYRELLDQQTFNVTFQIPIVQWGRASSELRAAEAQRREVETSIDLQRRSLEQDIYFQTLRFLQLQTQVALAAKADTIADRRFEVARNRYLIGNIDITNFLIAQAEKDNARFAYISTLSDYWVSYYQFRRLTMYDFETERGDRLQKAGAEVELKS